MGALWDLAARTGMTCFGTSAALHRRLHEGRRRAGRGPRPVALRASARPARRSRPRASSGSTSTSARTPGCSRPAAAPTCAPRSSAACPLLPVYRASCRRRSLGAKVEAWDEDGHAVIDEVGELVITEPMPSMPIYFWGDDGRLAASARRTSRCTPGCGATATGSASPTRGTAVIYGRSDSTINRGGVRMGTSEIYRAVLALDEVARRAGRGHPRDGRRTSWMPLFVVLREGAELDDDARSREIAQARSARTARRATCPNEVHADRRGAAHALGQDARGAGQADPDGRRRPSRRRAATRSRTRRRWTSSSSSPPTARSDRAGLRPAAGSSRRAPARLERSPSARASGAPSPPPAGAVVTRARAPTARCGAPTPRAAAAAGLPLAHRRARRRAGRRHGLPWHIYPRRRRHLPAPRTAAGPGRRTPSRWPLSGGAAARPAIRFAPTARSPAPTGSSGARHATARAARRRGARGCRARSTTAATSASATPGRAGARTIRPALGAFNHEAACVDPVGRHLYLTEDQPDGALYRFTPDALSGPQRGAARGRRRGGARQRRLARLPTPDQRATPGRRSRARAGSTAARASGSLRARLLLDQGRQPRVGVRRAAGRSRCSTRPSAGSPLRGVDNLTVTLRGRAVRVRGRRQHGDLRDLGRADRRSVPAATGAAAQGPAGRGNELAGVAFSPAGDRMYFSAQRAFGFGVTVRGPRPVRGRRRASFTAGAATPVGPAAAAAEDRHGAGDLGRPAAHARLRRRGPQQRGRQRSRGAAHGRARARPGAARVGRPPAPGDAREGAQAGAPGPHRAAVDGRPADRGAAARPARHAFPPDRPGARRGRPRARLRAFDQGAAAARTVDGCEPVRRGVACPESDPQRRENRDVPGHPWPDRRGGRRGNRLAESTSPGSGGPSTSGSWTPTKAAASGPATGS